MAATATAAALDDCSNPSRQIPPAASAGERTSPGELSANGSSGGREKSVSPSRSPSPSSGHGHVFQGFAATRRSRVRVWMNLAARWLLTVAFIAAVYIVLIVYSRYEVISAMQKRLFSALITGFLIALALLTLSHLLNIAIDLKWWILSRRPRSQQKIEAILRVNSISQTIRLAFGSKRPLIHASVGYAAMGLCYAVEKTEDIALMRPGNITITNLDTVEPQRVVKYSNSVRAQRYSANSYGAMSLTLPEGTPDEVPRPHTLWFSDDPAFFCDNTSCLFVFKEANSESFQNNDAIPVFISTDRIVNVSSSCSSHRVTRGGNGTDPSFAFIVEGSEVNVSLPIQAGLGQSTFMTDVNDEGPDNSGIVQVLEASPTEPWYYNCTTTIGTVTNAVLPIHKLGSNLTRLATTGIALQGYAGVSDIDGNIQAVVYPAASFFGVPVNGSAVDMEKILSRFAVGVVAMASFANAAVSIYGEAPFIGQRLNVQHWPMVHLIFALTGGLQLLLAICVVWLTYELVIPPAHPVAEAQVLRPMMAEGRAENRALGRRHCPKTVWVYRAEYVGDGLYDLYMEGSRLASSGGGVITQNMQPGEPSSGLPEKNAQKDGATRLPSDNVEALIDYAPHVLDTINEEDSKELTSPRK